MAQTSRVSGVATSVYSDGIHTIVRYHNTDVVKFNETEIILNTGGWHSNTTRTRMNQAANQFRLGFNVYQRDYAWFVDFAGSTYDMVDGMRLNRASGNVHGRNNCILDSTSDGNGLGKQKR